MLFHPDQTWGTSTTKADVPFTCVDTFNYVVLAYRNCASHQRRSSDRRCDQRETYLANIVLCSDERRPERRRKHRSVFRRDAHKMVGLQAKKQYRVLRTLSCASSLLLATHRLIQENYERDTIAAANKVFNDLKSDKYQFFNAASKIHQKARTNEDAQNEKPGGSSQNAPSAFGGSSAFGGASSSNNTNAISGASGLGNLTSGATSGQSAFGQPSFGQAAPGQSVQT